MRKALSAAAVWLAFLVPAHAETYVVGVEGIDYKPNGWVENGEYVGYGRAVLDAWAKDRHHTLRYRPMPVQRLFSELLQGVIDFKYPDSPHWQQAMKEGKPVTYSEPVAAFVDGVMVLPENKGKGAANLHSLGILHGFTAWDYLDVQKAGKISINENPVLAALLQQDLNKRVDGIYISIAVAQYQLDKVLKQPDALVFDPGLPHSKGAYTLSSLKHPEAIADFNAWMAQNPTVVARLKEEYGIEKGFQ